MKLQGLREAEAALNRRIHDIGASAADEVVKFGLAVMGEASRNAPVDTGDLRASFVLEVDGAKHAHTDKDGNVTVDGGVVPDADKVTVTVGTSGIPYATRQHEDMTYQHPKGGGPKFLENAINSLGPTLVDRLKARLRGGGS